MKERNNSCKDTYPTSIHSCFEFRGNDNSCKNTCPISENQCRIMLHILYNKIRGMNGMGKHIKGSISGLTDDKIIEVVDNTIQGVQNGIEKFRGEKDSQFNAWMVKIFMNKRATCFRKLESEYKRNLKEEKKLQCYAEHKKNMYQTYSYDIDYLIDLLIKKVGQEKLNAKDIDLIKALYEGNEQGYTQAKMAGIMGLKPDNFKQRKRRLIQKLEKHGFGKDVLSNIFLSD